VSNELVPRDNRTELVVTSNAAGVLARVRPEWRARDLIRRVERLLPVDPSSACQRLFNAAIHDLRQKIVTAGMDVAREAASRYRLPPVDRAEEVADEYPTARVIDLAYRMGLLTRAEWRRLQRCYEIRRDLEHEDAEYEAHLEDIVYIFTTCVEVVLSRDPVELIRVSAVEELMDAPQSPSPSAELLHEYEAAPAVRQQQILERLVVTALDSRKADIIRQNAVELLRAFAAPTRSEAQIVIGQMLQQRIQNKRLELGIAKVAWAAGVLGYLKQRQVEEFYEWLANRLDEAGFHWKKFEEHGRLLNDFEDVGAFQYCPPAFRV